jgi:hypothetical protein
VLELGGIRDVLAKSLGTTNPINMLKAAEVALKNLRRPEEVAKARGKAVSDVLPYRPDTQEVSDTGTVSNTSAGEEVTTSGEAQADAGA